jgi:hypothetical protein
MEGYYEGEKNNVRICTWYTWFMSMLVVVVFVLVHESFVQDGKSPG